MVNQSLASRIAAVALTSALLLAGAACASDDDSSAPPPSTDRPDTAGPTVRQPTLEGTVSVLAAEPLAEVMPLLVERFRAENPAIDVTMRFDSTPVLTMELLDGASADVFIAADQANMAAVVAEGATDGTPRVLALARLVIVTAPGNPSDIVTLADLAGAGSAALCSDGTPCGVLTDAALDAAAVSLDGTTRVASGRDAIESVVAGDVEAAVVFAADARAAGDAVEVVDLRREVEITGHYTIATLVAAVDGLAARAFVEFALSDEATELLERYGFDRE
ncbi:MAG: molybdate ABC transporter substrate-binding protein [Acidimicrobiales bacterium]|nr:molybdate ABC transporter substrate-binding protein [Acidimicrobiales bacterium]